MCLCGSVASLSRVGLSSAVGSLSAPSTPHTPTPIRLCLSEIYVSADLTTHVCTYSEIIFNCKTRRIRRTALISSLRLSPLREKHPEINSTYTYIRWGGIRDIISSICTAGKIEFILKCILYASVELEIMHIILQILWYIIW